MGRWRLRGALLLGLTVTIGAALSDDVSRFIEVSAAKRGLSAIPGLARGAVTLSPDGHTLLVADLRVAGSIGTLRIGRLAISQPGGFAGFGIGAASAATAAVVLDDVTVLFRGVSVSVPHLEAKGSPLSAVELAGIFDAERKETLSERLDRFTAAEIVAPKVILTRTGGEQTATSGRITIEDVRLANVAGGRIGALALGQLAMLPADPTSTFKSGGAGPITLSDLDLPLLLKLVEGSRVDAEAPIQPLLGHARIEAASFKDADGEIKVGAFEIDGLAARPPRLRFSALDAQTRKPVDERTPEDRRALADAYDDLARSFKVDRLRARDMAFRSDAETNAFSLGSAAVEGLDPSHLKSLSFERFSLTSDEANVAFDRLSLEGYDQTLLLDAARARVVSETPENIAEDLERAVPTFAHLSLRTLRIDAKTDDMKGNALQGRRTALLIPTADLSLTHTPDAGTASSFHTQLLFDIPPDVPDPNLQQLRAAGFDHLDLSFDYGAGWNAQTRSATLDRLAVSGQGLGTVTIRGDFANMAPELFAPSHQDLATQAAQDVEVRTVEIDVQDAGLAAKVWALAAKGAGVSVPLLKAEAKGQAQVAVLKAFGNKPAATRISEALSTFIDNPTTLTLTVKAPPGLSVRALSDSPDGQALLDRLDIEATAGK